MPRISEFYGIVISMYFNDHAPPHFHAKYAEHRAAIAIDTLAIQEGHLPRRAMNLVQDWGQLHQTELQENWQRAMARVPLIDITPLP